VWWYSAAIFRPKVKELWSELQRVLAEARQARLDDPQLLSFIYGVGGHEKLDKLAVVWHEAEENLNKKTHEVAAAADNKVADLKPAFMAVLQQFCDQTVEMNHEFTAKALQALEAEITRKLAEPTDGTQAPPKAALA
jgi:hypothetical protein